MTLPSRIRVLARLLNRGGSSGCTRCDDPGLHWRAVLVVNGEDPLHCCPLCGRLVDAQGNPIGIERTGGPGKVIRLHDPQAERLSTVGAAPSEPGG